MKDFFFRPRDLDPELPKGYQECYDLWISLAGDLDKAAAEVQAFIGYCNRPPQPPTRLKSPNSTAQRFSLDELRRMTSKSDHYHGSEEVGKVVGARAEADLDHIYQDSLARYEAASAEYERRKPTFDQELAVLEKRREDLRAYRDRVKVQLDKLK